MLKFVLNIKKKNWTYDHFLLNKQKNVNIVEKLCIEHKKKELVSNVQRFLKDSVLFCWHWKKILYWLNKKSVFFECTKYSYRFCTFLLASYKNIRKCNKFVRFNKKIRERPKFCMFYTNFVEYLQILCNIYKLKIDFYLRVYQQLISYQVNEFDLYRSPSLNNREILKPRKVTRKKITDWLNKNTTRQEQKLMKLNSN